MNKIGILTLYFKNYNYGGQLQAYALCKFLNETGICEAEQISLDYHRRSKLSCKGYLFLAYEYLFKYSIMRKLNNRKRIFDNFSYQIPHSKKYKSLNNISNQDYDVLIVGSDQIWNLDYTSDEFFLENIYGIIKTSYAASFGKNNIQKIIDDKKNALIDFSFLTVREVSAKKALKDNGIESEIVCDPTILLTTEMWEKNLKLTEGQSIKGKYIFIYLLGDSREKRKEIKDFAKKRKLKIVYIPHIHFSFQKRDVGFGDIEVYDVGPREFLKLIKEAEFIITDSFHCCVFSILFKKQFWVIDRESNNENSTNNRIVTLLDILGLKERYVSNFNCDNIKRIDFNDVQLKLNEYRKKSIDLLSSYLKQL